MTNAYCALEQRNAFEAGFYTYALLVSAFVLQSICNEKESVSESTY
jgi:hypothetical protein